MARKGASGGSGTGLGNGPLIVLAIVIGFFLIPTVAGAAPEIVNGTLLLLIIGAILLNSGVWLPYLAQLGTALSAPAPTTNK